MSIFTYTISITNTGNKVLSIPVAYKDVNSLFTNIPNLNNIQSYTIKLKNDGSVVSEPITFNLIKNDYKYPRHQLAFLNRLGSYSYFTFTGKMEEQTKVERKTFLKNNVDEKQYKTIYSIDVDNEYIFNSGYINQSMFDYLEELFTSPKVYLINETESIPIVITDTTWYNKKKINEKEISFSIKAKLSNKKTINV